MSEQPLLWWVTRSTGMVALLLLTLALVLGVGATRGAPGERVLRQGVHRRACALALGLVAAHVTTCVVDGYVDLSWRDVVLPFGAGYSPVAAALGALAVDVLLALLVTSLLRRRLRGPHWRRVHLLAYACWPLSLAHALAVGSDVQVPVVRGVAAGCTVAVALAVGVRLATARRVVA